jgi:hypothetical protein
MEADLEQLIRREQVMADYLQQAQMEHQSTANLIIQTGAV